MQHDEFAQSLRDQGFGEIVTVTRPAAQSLDVHTHPFEAKALILQGEIRLELAGVSRTYAVGDVFHLQAHEPHAEFYGPQGVTYLVGRKTV
ncbi:MAG: cupin domain-containing protein [Burkholderiaceae bacterium]